MLRFRCRCRRSLTLAGLTILGVSLGGCPPPGPGPGEPSGPSGDVRLIWFESPQDLLTYFKQQASSGLNRGAGFGLFGGFAPDAPAPQGTGAEGGQGATTGGDQFSTTNIQEAGVDESDVFKSDGIYFYLARGQSLRIIRANPIDQLAEVARLDLDMQVDALYLYDATLIALGTQYDEEAPPGPLMMSWPPYYRGATLQIAQIDISDPAAPSVIGEASFDGSLVESRLTNDRLIVVLTIVPELPADPTPLSVAMMSLDQVMPKMRHTGGPAQEMVPWEQWLRPVSPDGYNMTAVVTLDAADIQRIVHSVAVIADAGTIYASPAALYVSGNYYDSQSASTQTALHKFTFDDNGAAQYTASGSIPGTLLNQFSLGEHNGYLRAATHVEPAMFFAEGGMGMGVAPSAQPQQPLLPYNAVYVLGEAAGRLEITGRVEGIAPDETLHAARFLGDHGFLVTFRKIDPLFVLDLANPADPKVVGELKVPGFSDYLHPLDETHLIGVGKHTISTSEGFDWFQGVQVSLFDVSDWSNPRAIQQLTFGGRGSECDVLQTHKAFTFLPERNWLALPMSLTTQNQLPWEYGDPLFTGVLVFQVDPATGFTELGRLEAISTPVPGVWPAFGWGWGWGQWQRAAFIGEQVYALTPGGVRAALISDFSTTHELTLPE